MSEEKKVIKKVVKVKKAPAPITITSAMPEDNGLSILEKELAGIDVSHISAPKQSNDDDFDKLLNEFIASELDDLDTVIEEKKLSSLAEEKPKPKNEEEFYNNLKPEEKALFTAYIGFINAANTLAENSKAKPVTTSITADSLHPNYKPSIGKIIASDTVKAWEIMLKTHSSELAGLKIDSSDDQLLDFAEQCKDNNLTLAIISYVETIIEIESCELTYYEKAQKAQRRRIERQIYEEHQRRIERNKRFIKEIQRKNFPVDAERLINNYFKTAQKDTEGAYKVLTTNPAVFAPIQVEKLKPSFLGLIKPTPKDGIRINKKLADFLKSLKA